MRSRFMAMEAGRKTSSSEFKAPTGAKLTQPFTYTLSPYDNALMAERTRAAEHRRAQGAISSYAFAPPTTVPQRDKHKPGVLDDPSPYLSVHVGDPYDAALDDALREKWLQESLLLHGPMQPPGMRWQLDGPPSKADARDVALTLQKTLCEACLPSLALLSAPSLRAVLPTPGAAAVTRIMRPGAAALPRPCWRL